MSTPPALERLRRRCPSPSAEPTIRYCLSISLFYVFSDATVLSPSFHPCLQRYFPTLIISIFAPERIAEPLATKHNDLSLPQVLMFPHHTLRSTNLHGTLTTPSDAPTQPSWPAHHTLRRYNTTFMARSPHSSTLQHNLHGPLTTLFTLQHNLHGPLTHLKRN